ncbi:MAG: hypothetical protein GIKADHBN_00195 [Phycisphaerales bacterium]|nr:hypothetical protein [Phycisphaerales bacterium]
MRTALTLAALTALVLPTAGCALNQHDNARPAATRPETQARTDERMVWWTHARFGMFIHWGLYAIPAGRWGERTDYGEWIRDSARIPVDEYDKLRADFNPAPFNAEEIVLAAKNAGMQYIVITSKHHDGFCLFDSKLTDWDVMSTPFKRDIMREMADACARHGIRLCWYYSIMDWHHPDYLPRRPWERAGRPDAGADFNRYVAYMKGQLNELLSNYGPIGVLWFDGQWEGTWTDQRGQDLESFVRSLQPDIIINSRVGRSGGAFGLEGESGMLGDYATPEQTIPPTAIRTVPWETCMTMNGHWGYNAADKNFKSATDLIRKLADIASKGGNFLLNVGPTAEGKIPPESVERLQEIGRWMSVNAESVRQTEAGPYDAPLDWGCVTQKPLDGGRTRLYLHVFNWPASGRLVLPGLLNDGGSAHLLASPATTLNVSRAEDSLVIELPAAAPDPIDSVIVLDLSSAPDLNKPPTITADADIFVEQLTVSIETDRPNVMIRATTDGSEPTLESPAPPLVPITESTVVKARAFRAGRPVSPVTSRSFAKVAPMPPVVEGLEYGLDYEFFEAQVKSVSELDGLTAKSTGQCPDFRLPRQPTHDNWCYRFRGLVRIPADGVYTFYTKSDDGSRLTIGTTVVVDNDGPHSAFEKSGKAALAAGWHPIEVTFFENTGGNELVVSWAGPGIEKQTIPARVLARRPAR